MGVLDLNLMNITLLAKWVWKFKDPTYISPWKTLITYKYDLESLPTSPFWKAVLDIAPIVQNSISFSPNCSTTVSFWHDIWYGESSLATQFPHLYNKCTLPNIFLHEVMATQGDNLRYNRQLAGMDLKDWENLQNILCTLLIDDNQPPMQWRWSSSEFFTVKSLYQFLNFRDNEVGQIAEAVHTWLPQSLENIPLRTFAGNEDLVLIDEAQRGGSNDAA
ncbi:uncharacterized protein LOC144574986 [Carex rostrata]